MYFGIEGRSALVVSGSKGIGFKVAKLLAAEGVPAAVLARTKTDLDAAVETIRGDHRMAIGVGADASVPDRLSDAIRQVSDEHGQAKYQRPGDFADITDLNRSAF
jgi:3-oxoacyl-[acyl-carrier protein] reductase